MSYGQFNLLLNIESQRPVSWPTKNSDMAMWLLLLCAIRCRNRYKKCLCRAKKNWFIVVVVVVGVVAVLVHAKALKQDARMTMMMMPSNGGIGFHVAELPCDWTVNRRPAQNSSNNNSSSTSASAKTQGKKKESGSGQNNNNNDSTTPVVKKRPQGIGRKKKTKVTVGAESDDEEEEESSEDDNDPLAEGKKRKADPTMPPPKHDDQDKKKKKTTTAAPAEADKVEEEEEEDEWEDAPHTAFVQAHHSSSSSSSSNLVTVKRSSSASLTIVSNEKKSSSSQTSARNIASARGSAGREPVDSGVEQGGGGEGGSTSTISIMPHPLGPLSVFESKKAVVDEVDPSASGSQIMNKKKRVRALIVKHLQQKSQAGEEEDEGRMQPEPIDTEGLLSRLPYKKMLNDIFGGNLRGNLHSENIPYVTRAYEEAFMREPLNSTERECAKGAQCECMFIDRNQPFVGVEFLLPGEVLPRTPHLCVLCCRATTQQLYYDVMFDKAEFPGVIQRYGNIHSEPGEYALDAMLISVTEAPVHIMPLPIVSHQRNRYTVHVIGGIKRIKQSRVYFHNTPSCSAGNGM